MVNLPPVTIGLITYKRPYELIRTLDGLRAHLTYRGELRWLVSDDNTPSSPDRAKRNKILKSYGVDLIITERNSGWGANANFLMQHIDTDYTFFIEDDYVLTRPLDLSLGVALLEEKKHLGMLRYRGTAGDVPVFHQFEADISAYVPDWREGVSPVSGKLTYLQFDGGSPTLYIYSHGAHLKHRRFHDYYGLYPEGLKLGVTEETYAHTVKGKMQADPDHAPGIAILPEWIPMYFDHIGQSFQGTEEDK